MRRALSQFIPASTPWLSQLSVATNQCVTRSAGEASTSYGSAADDAIFTALVRGLSGKGAAKGKATLMNKASATPPPPPPPAAATSASSESVLASAGARLRRRRPGTDPLTLLTPQQRLLAEMLVQRPGPPAPAGGAGGTAEAATPAAEAAATPVPLRGVGQIGLPLDRRDVSALLHQALSGTVGQNVHFQPFVFSNIFQSAPAAATYVAAALESGASWGRVERFFLAAVEADSIVRGVRVEVRGRMGRKADMSSCKVWEWGEMSLRALSDRLDYGAAAANTRMGVMGVKVWIRYKTSAIKEMFYPPTGGSHHQTAPAAGAVPSLSLDELYDAAVARTTRVALPYKFTSVGWWERTAAEQPPENRVQDVFVPDFDPAAGDRLDSYLRLRREERRCFRSAAERLSYMATTGRYLAKRRRLAQWRAAGQLPAPGSEGSAEAPAAALWAPLGRSPTRALGRFRLAAFLAKRRDVAVLRHRQDAK